MDISAPFVKRPVATTLLTAAVALAGLLALPHLPVAPLPQVDLPVIVTYAAMPGASPDVMATTVATPLERRLGAISGVYSLNSFNSEGVTAIVSTFDFGRNANGAAREVQAAINAARTDLPAALRATPTYLKVNLGEAELLFLTLTSRTMDVDQIYARANELLKQTLSSVDGVGQVYVLGSSKPAVRVEIDSASLAKYGIGMEAARNALAAANVNIPKGALQSGAQRLQIYANDQMSVVEPYRDLIVAYRNGLPVRLSDVAEVSAGVENSRNIALVNGAPAIVAKIFRAPGANIVDTVDRLKARLPELATALSPAIDISASFDRTTEIRAALGGLEHSLIATVGLIMATVFAFLKSARAAVAPLSITVASLTGAFAIMKFAGFSLNNISLMALIIATGLVVDDAIIVLENVTRHIERGMSPREAAIFGAREVSFTIVAVSLSLVAIFIPFLFAGDLIGSILNEFAGTLSAAILISLVLALTTAPMLCARLLPTKSPTPASAKASFASAAVLRIYAASLMSALAHPRAAIGALIAMVAVNACLFVALPKGFFPKNDPGRLFGFLEVDSNSSFDVKRKAIEAASAMVLADPAVANVVVAAEDGQASNVAQTYVELKPAGQRLDSVDAVALRLDHTLNERRGMRISLRPQREFSETSGEVSQGGGYKISLRGDDLAELRLWTQRLTDALKREPSILDPSSDQEDGGLETWLDVDRDMASRLGLSMMRVDNELYDAFGQRIVSTIFSERGERRVVMEMAANFMRGLDAVDQLYVTADAGAQDAGQGAVRKTTVGAVAGATVPLATLVTLRKRAAPLQVSHKDSFVATTISFDAAPGHALGEAMAAIDRVKAEIHMPSAIHAGYAGVARLMERVAIREALLFLLALATIYIALGILYESFLHPLTILSTLPPAGVGALIALKIFNLEFTLISFVAIILLAGVVKKNAIMIVDVAIRLQARERLEAKDAICQAALLRFRPIMMTTAAAVLSAIPLSLARGPGAELQQALGVSLMGGLIASQIVTLYATPVVFLCMEKLRVRMRGGAQADAASAKESVLS